mgnify:CR=1 FL=1
MIIAKFNRELINKAEKILKKGGVVIFPTDTVYGFLADALSKKAVEKIYKIKKRPKSKTLLIFVKDLKMAKDLVEISLDQEKIIKKYWPGKYTFVLKAKSETVNFKSKISKLVINKNKTIGIRTPNYKPLKILLKKINRPVAQTSANISGQTPFKTAEEIYIFFKNKKYQPDLIIDAGKIKTNPSKIIDLTLGKIEIIRK